MISVNPEAIRFFKRPNGEYDDVNAGEDRIHLIDKLVDKGETDAEKHSESSLESQATPEAEPEQHPNGEYDDVNAGEDKINLIEDKLVETDAENFSESSLESQAIPEAEPKERPNGEYDDVNAGEDGINLIEDKLVDKSETDVEKFSDSSSLESQATPEAEPKRKRKDGKPLTPFYLPPYASPWLFIPAYIEPSFTTCSAVYVRHPTARPGYSEIPTPYDADGTLIRYAWEWYVQRRPRMRSKGQLSRMPEDRTKIPLDVGKERRLLLMDVKPTRKRGYHVENVREYSEFGSQ